MLYISKFTGCLVLIAFWGCSIDPKGFRGKGKSNDEEVSAPAEVVKEANEQEIIQAYSDTLHPILEKNCGTCHGESKVAGPSFALKDAIGSYKEITTAQKVDRGAPEKSRIVLRVGEENHNCWGDCKANAQEMVEAINLWAEQVGAGDDAGGDGYVPEGQILEDQAIKVIAEKVVNPNSAGVYGYQAENAQLNLFEMTESTIASNGKFIGTTFDPGFQVGGFDNNNPGQAFLEPDLASAIFTFWIDEAGTYTIFARHKTESNQQDSFYIRMDGGETSRFVTPTSPDWRWERANNLNQTDLEWELEAGKHTFEVRQRETGNKLDMIVVTNDFAVDLDTVKNTPLLATVFKYDLSDITGIAGSRLEIQVEEYDEVSYLLSSPILYTGGEAIKVKEMHILLNGKASPLHSTFLTVDEEIPAGEEKVVLSTAAALVLKDKGIAEDMLSFAFTILE